MVEPLPVPAADISAVQIAHAKLWRQRVEPAHAESQFFPLRVVHDRGHIERLVDGEHECPRLPIFAEKQLLISGKYNIA